GTFACELSSADTAVTITNPGTNGLGAKASIDFGQVQSSAPATKSAVVTLKNTGTIDQFVKWTLDTTGGLFGTNASGNVAALPTVPVLVVPAGQSQSITIGFTWAQALTNSDLGKSGKAVYTASCTESQAALHPNVNWVANQT